MTREDPRYQNYVKILEEELLPAMGCTEPIAISYCAAVARDALGLEADRVTVSASGNIIKNVKSVVVPNTGGLRGIPAAAAAGIVAGDPARRLEVIASVSPEQKEAIRAFLEKIPVELKLAGSPLVFDIVVTLHAGDHYSKVRAANFHTNIVLIERDGEVLEEHPIGKDADAGLTDRSVLNVKDILDFAETVDPEDVRELLDRQIAYNTAISEEGLRGSYGANIGSVLLASNDARDVKVRAKAAAAAGSDARMNGCEMPVVINSGSGNQGITASVPVIVFARELGVGQEKLYRALVLSNLLAIHQKTGIGRLSAYCGAVNAGAAAGCGIAYLKGGGLEAISHTLANALAIVSGMICDGAKASCAGKIAAAVDAGLLGYDMYCQNQQFHGGDGILKKGIENVITSVGRLGRVGMRETDQEILNIMLSD